MRPVDWLSGTWRSSGRRHRRATAHDGTAHIEVRALRRPGMQPLGADVERMLRSLEGVRWAEVDAVLGRVIVAFDEGRLGIDELVDVVGSVEELHDVAEERFGHDRVEHPADRLLSQRALAEIVADAAGLGLSAFGAILRASPLPIEVAGLVSLVDGAPRLRNVLEERLGPSVSDISLAMTNAVAQGLASGPFTLATDLAHRLNQYSAARAAERCWDARQDELVLPPGAAHQLPVEQRPRPVPLPRGPVERYSDSAGLAALAAAGATVAATADVRRSAAVLLAAIPKPARLGREAFAAQLGRVLAGRGVLVVDQRALRLLDRVDCVIIEERLAVTGRGTIERVEVAPDEDHVEVRRRLRSMFDPDRPERVRRRGGWTFAPMEFGNGARSGVLRRLIAELGTDQAHVLRSGDRPIAVCTVAEEVAAGARQLVELTRGTSAMAVVAGDDPAMADRLAADLWVPGGERLADSIRDLQIDDCVVALVAGDASAAHRAADCGIGVIAEGGQRPSGADIVCADGLADAAFVVEAAAVARQVSRQSAALALIGSSAGSLLAVTGSGGASVKRATTAVNVASLTAMVNGARAGFVLRPTPLRRPAPPWHELTADEVLDRLESGPSGLDDRTARRRLAPRERTPSAPVQLARAVVDELANPLTPVLAGGAALSAAAGSPVDAAIVGSVAGIGALVGGAQRFQSDQAVRALARSSDVPVRVRRRSGCRLVPSGSLVPGDVLELDAGDLVPADARVLEATNLEVDEANLTGESVPAAKGERPVVAPTAVERSSMLYEGTTVAAGSAVAVVVATGSDTEASAGADAGLSPPSRGGVEGRLRKLSAITLPFAGGGGAAVVASGLLRGRPLSETLSTGVSLAVAAIPEGLPVLTTSAQLAAARRLSAQGALVRNPRAIEALGRIDVLCTDKTGTLTEGRIELRAVWDGRAASSDGRLVGTQKEVVAAARRASPLPENGEPLPHMTDRAVLRGAERLGVDEQAGVDGWVRTDEQPFEPGRGYHATLGRCDEGALLSVKGAPEVVIARCSRWRQADRETRLAKPGRERAFGEVDRLARSGLRVLAVAERRFAGDDDVDGKPLEDDGVADLVLVGLIGLADPVRPTAAEAVAGVQAAGVSVVMVTGDHPSTAEGIAAELGILNGKRVLTGAELSHLDDSQLDGLLEGVSVFARVTPTDKVRIVGAYQRAGRAVAMTGDGANDAPAILLADAGLALGERSTPAARSAADVVITDDRIETIVEAIIEGRAMWAAVRDALAILLGGNLGEIAFTAGASALTGRSPLSARQLLLVNLLTDIAPALTIAVRPPAGRSPSDLAAEGPDRSLGGALTEAIVIRALATTFGAGSAWGLARLTGSQRRAGTVALVGLVGAQLGQTLLAGGRDPATVIAAVGASAALAAIVQTPGVSRFFGCTPLDPLGWAIGVGAATTATAAAAVAPGGLRVLQRALSSGG